MNHGIILSCITIGSLLRKLLWIIFLEKIREKFTLFDDRRTILMSSLLFERRKNFEDSYKVV